jgi:hypothetical protein
LREKEPKSFHINIVRPKVAEISPYQLESTIESLNWGHNDENQSKRSLIREQILQSNIRDQSVNTIFGHLSITFQPA